jgi:hypothetical protein
VGAADTQHMALAGLKQCHLDLTDPVEAIRGHQEKGGFLTTAQTIICVQRRDWLRIQPQEAQMLFQSLKIICPKLWHIYCALF